MTSTNTMGTHQFSPDVIYEDKDIIVINKPFGMITHPKNDKDTSFAVTSWLIKKYPYIASVGEDKDRPGIVHRLDRDTSGVMIIAKNQDSFLYLKNLFQKRTINKYYITLVHGLMKKSEGTIDLPIGRIGIKRTTRIVNGKLKDKKDALTKFRKIKNYDNYSLIEVSPKTGRTHQIRVHLNAIKHPICGDPIYGSKKLPNPQGLDRLFLHASKIQFRTPSGKSLSLESDLPDRLNEVLKKLDKN